MIKSIVNSIQQDIQVDDWVDVLPGYIMPDPQFGRSYKVKSLGEGNEIEIWVFNASTQEYEGSTLSCDIVEENYRRVPTE